MVRKYHIRVFPDSEHRLVKAGLVNANQEGQLFFIVDFRKLSDTGNVTLVFTNAEGNTRLGTKVRARGYVLNLNLPNKDGKVTGIGSVLEISFEVLDRVW